MIFELTRSVTDCGHQIKLCSALLCTLGYASWDEDDERRDGTTQKAEFGQDRVKARFTSVLLTSMHPHDTVQHLSESQNSRPQAHEQYPDSLPDINPIFARLYAINVLFFLLPLPVLPNCFPLPPSSFFPEWIGFIFIIYSSHATD